MWGNQLGKWSSEVFLPSHSISFVTLNLKDIYSELWSSTKVISLQLIKINEKKNWENLGGAGGEGGGRGDRDGEHM